MNGLKYKGYRIEPTLSASRELIKHGSSIYDIVDILEKGYDCNASKRKSNIEEKCLKKGKKEIKAVVALTTITYPDKFTETVWRLIHFGITTYKKVRRK